MKQISYDGYKKHLPQDAKDLSAWFTEPQPALVPDICSRFINIKHKEGNTYNRIDDLLSAQIVEMKNLTEVFDRADQFHGSFADLIDSVNNKEHGQQWIEGLRAALAELVSKRSPQPIRVPFVGAKRGVFWSHLHGAWSYDGKIDYFQVIFLEGFAPQVSNVPQNLDALETAVRWAYRSWWEIYGAFSGRLTSSHVDEIYRYTQISEQESESRGVTDPEILLRSFEDPEIRNQLQRNLNMYFSEYRNPETKDGKLDIAFRERDPKRMRKCLDELRPMSLWFLKIATSRFAELIAETLPEK
jgi:hypothetical protein